MLDAACFGKAARLSQGFAKDERRRDCDVERSQTGLHWYPYTGIGGRVDHIRYAGAFPPSNSVSDGRKANS